MQFDEMIRPYVGTASIRLYQTIEEVKKTLSAEGIPFAEELWSGENETNPHPWNVLIVENVMSLFFARNGKLFKCVFWENYFGQLTNGIRTGMSLADARQIDASLVFDEWNEDYESSDGYWLEDDAESGKIIAITVFIRELLDEDKFDACNW